MISNQVSFFLEDECEVGDQSFEVSKKALYKYFFKYCKEHNHPVLCCEEFFRHLKNGIEVVRYRADRIRFSLSEQNDCSVNKWFLRK